MPCCIWESVNLLWPSREKGEDVQRTGLVGRVLEDNIALLILVLAERNQDDVSVVDPDLFSELSADQTEAPDAIEALVPRVLAFSRQGNLHLLYATGTYHGLQSSVSKHLENLGVFLAILLEGQLALLITECRVKLSVEMFLVEKRCRALFFCRHFCSDRKGFSFFGLPYSFSFFPLRLFLPPFPLFLGILTVRDQASGGKMCGERGGRLGFVVRWICWRSIRSWLM